MLSVNGFVGALEMGKGVNSTFALSWSEIMTACVGLREKFRDTGSREPQVATTIGLRHTAAHRQVGIWAHRRQTFLEENNPSGDACLYIYASGRKLGGRYTNI